MSSTDRAKSKKISPPTILSHHHNLFMSDTLRTMNTQSMKRRARGKTRYEIFKNGISGKTIEAFTGEIKDTENRRQNK